MIGIGIIGAGDYGAQHAAALRDLSGVRLVAASRTNATALAEFTAQYGGTGYTDYHALLADPAVEAVVIATPHHQHTAIALAAAHAGKHILLEKPMAPTLAECDAINAAVDAAGVTLLVGHVNRFAPPYQAAKTVLESGDLGEVVFGRAAMQKYWFEPNRRNWHLDRAHGGGVWLTVGIHPLDRLTWLIDSPVISVSAQLGTRFHPPDTMTADDAGLVFLRYANGAAGTIVSVGYVTGAPDHSTELIGTRGMLRVDYVGGVQVGRAERWQVIPETVPTGAWMHAALVNEWQAFIRAITTGTPPAVSGHTARAIMRVAFAAEESARLGREVRLDEGETSA